MLLPQYDSIQDIRADDEARQFFISLNNNPHFQGAMNLAVRLHALKAEHCGDHSVGIGVISGVNSLLGMIRVMAEHPATDLDKKFPNPFDHYRKKGGE